MADDLLFPPLHNGLDYLQSVIEHLRGTPDERDLKYAVLHLQAATEVLLKVRLLREHWALVFKNMEKAAHTAYMNGDFTSITLEEALGRLRGIAQVELPVQARESFAALAKERNKLQHFGLAGPPIGIETLVGRVLDALLCFITDHLRRDATDDDLEVLDETQELLHEEMDRIQALVAARWARITPQLEQYAGYVVHCPGCVQLALPLDEPLRCLFCDRTWESKSAAIEYEGNVLGITWHDIAKGAAATRAFCPDCSSETLVGPTSVRGNTQQACWVCFSCHAVTDFSQIEECPRCGELMRSDDDAPAICNACLQYLVDHE